MVKKLKDIHRWVGIIIAVYIVMVTISGFVHIIAHNFYPAPKPRLASQMINHESINIAPAELGLENKASAINLRSIEGQAWYQVIAPGKVIYLNAKTVIAADMDAAYAKQITHDYLGKNAEDAVFINDYNSEYTAHGHSLPVWRVSAGNEWVYVSTIHGTIEHYLNPEKAITGQIFRNLHTFKFIPWHIPREIFMGLMVTGLLAVNIIGVVLFFKRKKKKRDKK